MISIIIPAAGQGKRMGLGYNKIYADFDGYPIFVATMNKFINYPQVGEIIIVVEKENVDYIKSILTGLDYDIKVKVVAGGKERQESVYNGLDVLSEDSEIVLIHDAARPMIDIETIERVIKGVEEAGAAICAVPVKDTIAVVNGRNELENVPDRTTLWAIQTPQGFRKKIIIEAHKKAQADNFLGTDDSSLVKRLGYEVKVVMGSYENIKITTPSDFLFAEHILKNLKNFKTKMAELVRKSRIN